MKTSGPAVRFVLEPYSASEMAEKAEKGGVTKAKLDGGTLVALSVLAGAFIGMGAVLSLIAATDTGLGFGPTRLLVGLAFSLGLVLVVGCGAELFTGNNLMVLAWARGSVTTRQVLRQWLIVYAGNFLGAAATALGVYLAGTWKLHAGQVGATAITVAAAKCGLTLGDAFFRGAYCNALVCLAVWLAYGARSTTDKILGVVFPITAFVAAGFEHSIANIFFIPFALLLVGEPAVPAVAAASSVSWAGFWRNLVPVTLGNLVGGAVMVGLVYWFVYLRRPAETR